jgi:hypothetical protein
VTIPPFKNPKITTLVFEITKNAPTQIKSISKI